MAAAPFCWYAVAILEGLKSGLMRPAEGLAFLTSAMTRSWFSGLVVALKKFLGVSVSAACFLMSFKEMVEMDSSTNCRLY